MSRALARPRARRDNPMLRWTHSSARLERLPHMQEVPGSSPGASTNASSNLSVRSIILPMKFLRRIACLVAAIVVLFIFALALDAAEMDGVMMRDGIMMLMKHGKAAMPMDGDVTMTNGTVVSPDGTITLKGGREFRMHNGEVIMMDGHLMKGGAAAGMEPESEPTVQPIQPTP